MAVLSDLGVTVDLPRGWDGRISRRDGRERERAVLHLSTFPLPTERGDYGGGAVEQMHADDVLVVLLEFDPSATEQPLFQGSLPTSVDGAAFSPSVLQRVIAGQAGAQWFFSTAGRAFSLYVVLGQHANQRLLVPLVNDILRRITIEV